MLSNTRSRFALAGSFVLCGFVLSLLAAPSLPDELVTNWDSSGEPSGTMSLMVALWLIPGLTACLLALLAVVPRLDPLGENIESFRSYYDWFAVVFSGYLFCLHAGIIVFNLGYEFEFLLLVIAGLAALFYYVGIVLTHAKRNWFVGIRTPWTLSNDEVWDRTHTLGGRLFKLSALVTLASVPLGDLAIYVLLGTVLATAGITTVYSYYCYQQIDPEPSV